MIPHIKMAEADPRYLFLFPDRSLFIGPLTDNGMHAHHALQIVCCPEPVSIRLEDRTLHTRLTVLAPNAKHAVSGEHPAQCILLIDGESSLCQSIESGSLKGADALSLDSHSNSKALSKDSGPSGIYSQLSKDTPDCSSAVLMMNSILAELPGAPAPDNIRPLDHRIASACQFIQNDPDLKASLIEVSQHTGLSEGRFTHLFKEQMGIPLRKYILWLRLRKSVNALQHGLSLTDAAHEAGFADQAHMSRSFKEHFGSSPADLLTIRGKVNIHFCESGGDGP